MLIFLFVSCNLAYAVAGRAGHAISIVAKDGTCVLFSLADKPNVTFSATDIVITTSNEQISYPLALFQKLTFVDNNETNNIETVNSINSNDMDVYSIDGMKIDNLHTAPNGIYIIRNGKASIKYRKGK